MIRMIQSRSAAQAKAYFSEALAKSDYYVSDQELAGFWQGRLAERLGIGGMADKDTFFALAENRHPVTDASLTPSTREGRTTGYDINFHCPKSVSVLHALSGDNHILKAFQESVTEVMKAIEADSLTRVRIDGAHHDRPSGELVWAHFTHQTARPVDGKLPDPHLHSHCYVFNATWDGEEGRIKAGQFRDIKRDMPYYQAMFHKGLSDKLMELGYDIHRTDKSLEIEAVPQAVINLFSKRTDEIGRIAKEKGITNEKERAEIGARSRAKKQKGHSMDELRQEWKEQINNLGSEGKSDAVVRYAPEKEMQHLTAKDCVDHALDHCFVRASVMDERRFLETAFRHSIGSQAVNVQDIGRAYKQDMRLIHIEERSRITCTTKEVLAEEDKMVQLARRGKGKLVPLYVDVPELSLTDPLQHAAACHVLTTLDRVSIVRGVAGAGKTTLMKEVKEKVEAAERTMTAIAPTVKASRGVLRESGFSNAQTVATFLSDLKMQESIKNQVLLVDEAGMLGTKDMHDLLDVATKQNAQIILCGDTKQHAAVVRGDALRVLSTVADIKAAEVTKIWRQRNVEYRQAVSDLAKGDVPAAFTRLDEIGSIITIDPLKPTEKLVNDYMEMVRHGKDCLVISPTHAQGDEITQAIRAKLQEDGKLGKREFTAMQYRDLNYTEAQKADVRNYKDGQAVKFRQNVTGFKRGSVWTVETNKKEISLVSEHGEHKPLPIDKSQHYNVFLEKEIRLAKGDKVRMTDNTFDLNGRRLDNGMMLEVTKVANGKIELRNPKGKAMYEVDKEFGMMAHAHCITSQTSQAMTADEVFIYQPAGTFPASDAKQFYVSVSRGRDLVRIYTDDREELLEHAQQQGDRTSAIELTRRDRFKGFAQQFERTRNRRDIEPNQKQNRDHDIDR